MIKLIFRFAIRNLLRSRLRSTLALAMIASVFATLLFAQSLMVARNQDIVDTVTNSFIGAYQVQKKQYKEDHPLSATIHDEQVQKILGLTSAMTPATERVYVPSLISSATDSLQIYLVGLDALREATVTKVPGFLIEGRYLELPDACEEPQIYLGASLARALKVKLGEKLVLLTQAADQTIGNSLFRVHGIFSSKSDAFDKAYAFAHLTCARSFAGIQGAHELIFRSAAGLGDRLKSELVPALGTDTVLLAWQDKLPEIYRTIKANDVTINLMTAILFFVILLSLINTFLLSMVERTREFGMMIAIGISPLQIFAMILAEIFCAGVVGIALGTGLGSALIAYYQKTGFDLSIFYGETAEFGGFSFNLLIYPAFSFQDYIWLCIVALVFVLLSGLYPAILTLKKKPKDIL